MTKRRYATGSIRQRGERSFQLRYSLHGERFASVFKGSRQEARQELRRLMRAGDTGEHVATSAKTLAQWTDEWLAFGAPGPKNRREVSQRTKEGYESKLKNHVLPALGDKPLQKIDAVQIGKLYATLADKLSPRTVRHIHTVLGAALGTAKRMKLIAVNPMADLAKIPTVDDKPAGEGLTEKQLAQLVAGFQSSATMYPFVALAAATGARRNELLALRWSDLDTEKGALRIERAWEPTKKHGLRLKTPKTERGTRTISIDRGTISVLLGWKERLQRIAAGIPDGTDVDLSLIKLPKDALIFPGTPAPGASFDFAKPMTPVNVSKEFARRAALLAKRHGFPKPRLHELRAVHTTALLDAGIPVHTVAQRVGDDPAVLLRSYTRRTRSTTADEKLTQAIDALTAGFLRS